jgi:protein gp37
MAIAHRLEGFGQASYQGTARLANGKPVWTGRLNRATNATMRKPFTIREPSLVFVNSMSDFWHPEAEDSWRLEALAVMAATPHQYQVLTKRPEEIAPFLDRTGTKLPPNFWAGVTVERADFAHRIDTLRRVPARIRFLSLEPLLGPLPGLNLLGLHWVIAGGESGPGARLMRVDWVREIRDQCIAQRIAFYLKQYGLPQNNPLYAQGGAAAVARLDPGEKGGSLLDGRHWHEWPNFDPQPQLL